MDSISFVVLSAEDWKREQETLYVLQNSDLMKQIVESLSTHNKNSATYSMFSGSQIRE